MIIEIGIAAGDIWYYLDVKGEALFSDMVEDLEGHRDLLLMSLGWLEREGHIVVLKIEGDYRVSPRKQS